MKRKQKTATSTKVSRSQEAMLQTERDFKDALLMVSIAANLFVVSLWVALQVTSYYDDALVSFFINR